MKVINETSKVDDFGVYAGFRAEVEFETDEGERLFAYVCQVGDVDSYAITRESVMEAIDTTGEDNIERVEEYDDFRKAFDSTYGEFLEAADSMVGVAMDDYYTEVEGEDGREDGN
ncbi:MAG: hypothetical protein VZR02_03890 [Lachnospiraceae bacterium]|nr:hypothetical protein [Lachnospiraceae bacterium]